MSITTNKDFFEELYNFLVVLYDKYPIAPKFRQSSHYITLRRKKDKWVLLLNIWDYGVWRRFVIDVGQDTEHLFAEMDRQIK